MTKSIQDYIEQRRAEAEVSSETRSAVQTLQTLKNTIDHYSDVYDVDIWSGDIETCPFSGFPEMDLMGLAIAKSYGIDLWIQIIDESGRPVRKEFKANESFIVAYLSGVSAPAKVVVVV